MKIPNVIPYTYHQKYNVLSFMYEIPISLIELAYKVDPILKKKAYAKLLPVDQLCRNTPNWMPEIPFQWNDTLPISP